MISLRLPFLLSEKSDIGVRYDLFGSRVLLDYGNGGNSMLIDKLFDLNRDGKLNANERTLEFLVVQDIMGEDDDIDSFEDDDLFRDEEGFSSLDDIIGDDEDEWFEFGEEDF